MKDRLSQFGIRCREFRSRFSLTMGDQAKGLGISVAYISAIERGKRAVPEDYPLQVAQWMSLSEKDTQILRDLASGERTVVKVFPKNSEQALLAEDFARDLNGLTPEGVKQLRLVLDTCKSGKYSDHEIRERASLARAVFSLGHQLSFNILRIIENQLPVIDPDFSLQVDPDGSFGENLHIFSDSDGKTVNRFRSTEWLYNSAARETEDSRFKLAHELAHWILHRQETLTFLRFSRSGKILSRNAQAEHEADFFALEFLMPLAVVEDFSEAKSLARSAQVPLWAAQRRMRQISQLTESERERIRQLAAAAEERMRPRPVTAESPLTIQDTLLPQHVASAAVLHFPKRSIGRGRLPARKIKQMEESLSLFDYVDAVQRSEPQPPTSRSDQWFADFGWRG